MHIHAAGSLQLRKEGSRTAEIDVSSGRLEVYFENKWGTVCKRKFMLPSADVACRQLGFSRANSFTDVDSDEYVEL